MGYLWEVIGMVVVIKMVKWRKKNLDVFYVILNNVSIILRINIYILLMLEGILIMLNRIKCIFFFEDIKRWNFRINVV